MGFKITDSAVLPADSCPERPGWLVGKGHGDPAKERVLPFLPCTFRMGVASWASWNISRLSDGSQTCSWEGCVSSPLPGFWNPHNYWEQTQAPTLSLVPSIHPSHRAQLLPITGLPASYASASCGLFRESHQPQMSLLSELSHSKTRAEQPW